MKFFSAILGAGAFLALPALAQTDLKPGDRVIIGSTGMHGTVIEVGGYASPGSVNIKIHGDNLGPGYPNVGSIYDEKLSHVIKEPGAQQQAQAQPQAATRAPAAPTTLPPGVKAAAGTAARCQALIRQNYMATGADQTVSVSFLVFQTGASVNHTATYANDFVGRGHDVVAMPIHAKYQVLTHFADAYADDQLRTYDAHARSRLDG